MRKLWVYGVLGAVTAMEVVMFVTAGSYVQLGVAVIAYPLLVYFALKSFPRQKGKIKVADKPAEIEEHKGGIDIDKRSFLKLIGTAGLSFFLFSLLSKKAEIPFLEKINNFGKTEAAGAGEVKGAAKPTDSYTISEIDSGAVTYYGFVKQGGGWFIMQENSEAGSFRYTRGENGFPGNWVRREKLQYDYYHNVF